jgi:transcriptional regulator with XRE-family HTH domain
MVAFTLRREALWPGLDPEPCSASLEGVCRGMELAGRPTFGSVLRKLRTNARLTQQELAERANVSVEAIGTLERGARTRPRRDTVELLVRALQLSPEQTALLAGAIRVADPSQRSAPVLRPRADAPSAAPHDPAPELTSFVGRERECAEIASVLDRHHLVTIVGSGGVGKTRAALRVAEVALARYPDGVYLVSGLQLPPTGEPAFDVVVAYFVAYLKGRRALVVLDNCERGAAALREVASRIVQSCPSVRVLATSRQALDVPGERAYRLPPLAVPPPSCQSAEAARSYAAVQLFVDRARACDTGFALTDENADAVAEICRQLDGIPLTIELAATRIKMLAPRPSTEQLDQRFHLLASVDHGALQYSR